MVRLLINYLICLSLVLQPTAILADDLEIPPIPEMNPEIDSVEIEPVKIEKPPLPKVENEKPSIEKSVVTEPNGEKFIEEEATTFTPERLAEIEANLDVNEQGEPNVSNNEIVDHGLNSCLKQNYANQSNYDCGECESGLQDGLNKIINDITVANIETNHWGDILDSEAVDPENLTMKPDANFEDTLDDILNMMREQNPEGGNRLNWVMIGASESLHETTMTDGKINPRIAVKSPNSELIVTFNTDPNAAGFNSIEIMRWNGKEGRYEFQELSFPTDEPQGDSGVQQIPTENPHGSSHAGATGNVDVTGNKCKQCHKSPSMRPNWDSYRAWAGVVPSRDDMLERGEITEVEEGQSRREGLHPDARMYYNFLDQVADAKTTDPSQVSPAARRLAMLDIPIDTERQLEDLVQNHQSQNAPNSSLSLEEYAKSLTPQEQVELIRRRVEDEGYYRIRHRPDKTDMQRIGEGYSVDDKTADQSGPSQFMFDQMLSQNMCRVANDLKEHPNYDKVKYALHGAVACGEVTSGSLDPENQDRFSIDNYLPSEFIQQGIQFYKDNKDQYFGNLTPEERREVDNASSYEEIMELIKRDTAKSHDNANSHKENRHGALQSQFLQEIESMSEFDATREAEHYSRNVVTPERSDQYGRWHAIEDFGGVKGVPEFHTAHIAKLRFLLEPLNINIKDWSMAVGENTSDSSFSFSDQFSLFFSDQKHHFQFKNKDGSRLGCREAEELSKDALKPKPEERTTPEEQTTDPIAKLCAQVALEDAVPETRQVASVLNPVSIAPLEAEAKIMLQQCAGCHGQHGMPEFTGLEQYVEGDTDAQQEQGRTAFANFIATALSTKTDANGDRIPYRQVIQEKLGLAAINHNGRAMPPMEFPDNERFAEQYNVYPLASVQQYRRRMLGLYIQGMTAQSDADRTQTIRRLCGTIRGTNRGGEIAPTRDSVDGGQTRDTTIDAE